MIDFVAWGNGVFYTYGLFGLFILSVIVSSSILLYMPGFLFVMLAGHYYPPLVVGLVAAVGYTLGETTSYLLGRGGNYILEKKNLARLDKVEGWLNKHGFLLFAVFAAVPFFPTDLLGIVAGTLKYDLKKYWLGTFIGELIKCTAFAYIGNLGLEWLLRSWPLLLS
jgi:uncharacterized membrane protein YdjX (TVP38/TMEM64 family)